MPYDTGCSAFRFEMTEQLLRLRDEHRQALPRWLHEYNHPPTVGPPAGTYPRITRLATLSDQSIEPLLHTRPLAGPAGLALH